MSETCDRCGPAVGAAYRVDRIGELYLCGRCASRQWRALSAQGWTFWPLGVHALAPQASAVPDAAGLLAGPGPGAGRPTAVVSARWLTAASWLAKLTVAARRPGS